MDSLSSGFPNLPSQLSYEETFEQYDLFNIVDPSKLKDTTEFSAIADLNPLFPELVEVTLKAKNARINEILKTDIGQLAEVLNAEIGIKKLSFIHIAVITFNNELLSNFCENPLVKIDKQDSENCTALHHAAFLGNTVAIGILKNRGADGDLRNSYNGTYQHIIDLTTPPAIRENEPVPLEWQSTSNQAETMTVKRFFEETKAIWLDDYYVSRTSLVQSWRYPMLRNYPISKEDSFPMPTYRLSPASPTGTKGGLGLFSTINIVAGTHLGFYNGLRFDSLPNNDTCFEDGTNSLLARNSLTQINDGFPNVKLGVKIHKGIAKVEMFALENIKEGTQLLLNYGSGHIVKTKGPYVEFRALEARQLLKDYLHANRNSLLSVFLFCFFDNLNEDQKDQKIKLDYILQTPAVLQAMLLDGTIDHKKHGGELQKELWHSLMFGRVPYSSWEIVKLTLPCCQVIDDLKTNFPKASEIYRDWLLALPSQLEMATVKTKMTESAKLLDEALKNGSDAEDLFYKYLWTDSNWSYIGGASKVSALSHKTQEPKP
jgi:hypothetical protein